MAEEWRSWSLCAHTEGSGPDLHSCVELKVESNVRLIAIGVRQTHGPRRIDHTTTNESNIM